MIYIYFRNAVSGGAVKYMKSCIRYVISKNKTDVFFEFGKAFDWKDNVLNSIQFRETFFPLRQARRFLWLRKKSVRIVFIPYQIVPLIFWFTNKRLITMVRNMEPFSHTNFRYSTFNYLRNSALYYLTLASIYRSSQVICVAEHVKSMLVSRGIPASKLIVIKHGANDNRIVPVRDINSFSSKKMCLIVGSGLPYRGLEDILQIEASEIVDNYRFVWVGEFLDKEYQRSILSLKERSKIDVEFVGSLPHTEVLGLMKNTDVYLASSRIEACPNTALEALDMRCKIIAFETEAHYEFFNQAAIYYGEGVDSTLTDALLNIPSYTPMFDVPHDTWDSCFSKTFEILEDGLHSS